MLTAADNQLLYELGDNRRKENHLYYMFDEESVLSMFKKHPYTID